MSTFSQEKSRFDSNRIASSVHPPPLPSHARVHGSTGGPHHNSNKRVSHNDEVLPFEPLETSVRKPHAKPTSHRHDEQAKRIEDVPAPVINNRGRGIFMIESRLSGDLFV
jgi:hypothetical protein